MVICCPNKDGEGAEAAAKPVTPTRTDTTTTLETPRRMGMTSPDAVRAQVADADATTKATLMPMRMRTEMQSIKKNQGAAVVVVAGEISGGTWAVIGLLRVFTQTCDREKGGKDDAKSPAPNSNGTCFV